MSFGDSGMRAVKQDDLVAGEAAKKSAGSLQARSVSRAERSGSGRGAAILQ
jgi:hypothetical protein